jgi:quercetin dioxygenase-like cupin family protein
MSGYLRRLAVTGTLAVMLAMGAAPSSLAYAEPAQATAQPVTSFKLPDLPGKSVSLVRVSFPPNAVSTQHRHAGTVTAFILSGSIRSQITGGTAKVYKAGESFFEPPGVVHLVAENASSTEPAELLAIFIADDGAALTSNAQ